MINKIDGREALELKKIYNHYLDKRKEIMNSTKFRVEDVFGNVINKGNLSQDQITQFTNFFSPMDVNININIKCNFFQPRKKKNIDFQQSALPLPENLNY